MVASAIITLRLVHNLESCMRKHRSMKPSTLMVSPHVPITAMCVFALFVLVLLMEVRSWSTFLS